MGKLTLHARIEIGLAIALLLGSCSQEPDYSAFEAYDLADVARANSVNALSEIEALKSQISDLESQVQLNETNIDTLFSNAAADRETANDNAELSNQAWNRIARIEARLGM